MKKLFFILTIFLFLGCVKEGKNIHVQGRVWDPVLNKGVPNVKVKLIKETIFGGGAPGFDSGSDGKSVVTVTTDESGCFEIFHLGGIVGYRLQVPDIPDGYHIGGWSDESLANRVKKRKDNECGLLSTRGVILAY